MISTVEPRIAMQLERRDLRVLIAAEADNIDRLSASVSDLVSNIPELWRAVAKLKLLLELLEATGGKR